VCGFEAKVYISRMPFCHPTNSIKVLTEKCAFTQDHLYEQHHQITDMMSYHFTLLQWRPIPIRKLSGLISRWMKFLLWTYSTRPIICMTISQITG